jgi:hypothetical protein
MAKWMFSYSRIWFESNRYEQKEEPQLEEMASRALQLAGAGYF